MKSTLLLMTLNEIEGMKAIMPRIKPEWVDQILVADGGSTDGTVEWAKEQGYEVVVSPGKGLTKAYLAAWPKIRGDIVIYFSPDGNSVPEAIPDLIGKMQKGYDMVIASRYLGSAKSYDDDWVTRFGNLLFRTLINLLFKPKTSALMTDPFVMYRAHKKDLPSRLGIDKLEPLDKLFRTNSCWIPLLSIRALKNKIRWTEIPVDEPTRIGGIRKLQIFRYGALHLMQILREWTLK
ncbi:MAG: histidinol phosphate phosphatase [Deltaproteobacteria bacterium RIFCSPLOWO2_01_44_7]|nr:MAG: histidinol phosphate phosphatase [Deltaproteobacteria bacterium RIFCSPHIGHO2_01_FULL_43_49]OGQ16162.1 MAG: histidinol phosphate phosphatase [Deltaproteobacteria bacterium RIFCSPHIGHO2_02_FULL_44_53]OGQ29123.1 MAG: histidinol phosphate phosphatase [Deltaproteobacteria bacterium RIFCSPHIGHO2_12_FULL_44_21]OGQ32679.1 MAG: histidinol phosphate phosphatase [Deltaproteobacteria bacterium RIFCSPLOWO2_01_FULL_45_74]OGQ37536.1 MAG: histidinol phosphate phosphatase [Deltaproteobacteria bacterium 